MLIRCIRCEKLKLKHSILWLACLGIPVIPAIMGTFNYMGNLETLTPGWANLWTQETLFYANFFYAPLIGLCCSYLWRLEHRNHNWNTLMSAPVPAWAIILSKLAVILRTLILIQIWVGVLFLVSGKCIGVENRFPVETLGWLLRGTLAGAVIGALQLFLSMVIRSFALPIILALLGSIGSIYAAAKGIGLFFPYSLMMLGMNSNHAENMLEGQLAVFLASSVGMLLLFYLLSVLYLKKTDVKA